MMHLSEASDAMQGQLMGADAPFESVEIDTRRAKKSGLFFAIHGEQKNGHEFINVAHQAGALASVVDEPQADELLQHIMVDDTTIALGMLAAHWRRKFNLPVVGITGSNGKTTVSNIVKNIFDVALPGIAPQGSFNNHWGVPLTLLKLRAGDQSAVIEMGMNHAGELSYLGKIVQPTIGLITNAAAAHLEGLKTVEGVANAKGELLDFIAPNGTAILNRDDDFYADWLGRSTDRSSALNVQSFGRHPDADIRITAAELNRVTLSIHGQETQFECALLGAHNQLNIAASVAVAVVAGVEIEAIKTGLQNVQAVDGRLALCQAKNQNITLINDSYNANAASMRAAIDVLAASKGQTVLVLGAMGELGAESASIHQALAQYAKASDIDYLFTLVNQHGENYLQDMAAYLMGFGAQSQSFKTVQALQEKITNIAKTSTTVLIKGSRFCQMENVVQALSLKEATPC